MPDSGTNLRFQVGINGIEKSTAGLEDFGVLSCQIEWKLRDQSLAKPNVQALPGYSSESWRDGIPKINLIALDAKNESHIEWLRENLKIGDEITIRILAPGNIDVPGKQRPSGKLPRPFFLRDKTNEPAQALPQQSNSSRKPVWIQGKEVPECCGSPMHFVGQLNDDKLCAETPEEAKLWWHDAASFYVFTCSQCLGCKAVGQQY